MDNRHIELLHSLVPHLGDVPASSSYWADRASSVIATSTQDRDTYPAVDHTRGHGVFIYDLEGNEYLDVTCRSRRPRAGMAPARACGSSRSLSETSYQSYPGRTSTASHRLFWQSA